MPHTYTHTTYTQTTPAHAPSAAWIASRSLPESSSLSVPVESSESPVRWQDNKHKDRLTSRVEVGTENGNIKARMEEQVVREEGEEGEEEEGKKVRKQEIDGGQDSNFPRTSFIE